MDISDSSAPADGGSGSLTTMDGRNGQILDLLVYTSSMPSHCQHPGTIEDRFNIEIDVAKGLNIVVIFTFVFFQIL